jgi:hypothetical protein
MNNWTWRWKKSLASYGMRVSKKTFRFPFWIKTDVHRSEVNGWPRGWLGNYNLTAWGNFKHQLQLVVELFHLTIAQIKESWRLTIQNCIWVTHCNLHTFNSTQEETCTAEKRKRGSGLPRNGRTMNIDLLYIHSRSKNKLATSPFHISFCEQRYRTPSTLQDRDGRR